MIKFIINITFRSLNMDPQILIRLTKIVSEQNENPVKIEKKIVRELIVFGYLKSVRQKN